MEPTNPNPNPNTKLLINQKIDKNIKAVSGFTGTSYVTTYSRSNRLMPEYSGEATQSLIDLVIMSSDDQVVFSVSAKDLFGLERTTPDEFRQLMLGIGQYELF